MTAAQLFAPHDRSKRVGQVLAPPPVLGWCGRPGCGQRLETARKLLRIASDAAATPAERQTAYRRARRELDGLIVLPEATLAALEDRIASMLGAGPAPDVRRAV